MVSNREHLWPLGCGDRGQWCPRGSLRALAHAAKARHRLGSQPYTHMHTQTLMGGSRCTHTAGKIIMKDTSPYSFSELVFLQNLLLYETWIWYKNWSLTYTTAQGCISSELVATCALCQVSTSIMWIIDSDSGEIGDTVYITLDSGSKGVYSGQQAQIWEQALATFSNLSRVYYLRNKSHDYYFKKQSESI